ncbi:hypothetical protein N7475_000011 [Penicillium sp. IBT 31633x]|nr:hypothetical protein N7475_000011 [Penicillium sp. IBT 31633x]
MLFLWPRISDNNISLNVPITLEDNPYKLVKFEPYLSGTLDSPPPLTPGFKDLSYNYLIEYKNYLSIHRKIPEILKI